MKIRCDRCGKEFEGDEDDMQFQDELVCSACDLDSMENE